MEPESRSSGLEPVPKATEADPGRRQSFRAGFVVGAAVAVGIGLLIIQNGESAQLDWIAFHFRAPLWIMLFITLVAGGVITELGRPLVRRGLARVREERKRAKGPARR